MPLGNKNFVLFLSRPAKISHLFNLDTQLFYSDKHVSYSINVLAILGVHSMLTQSQSHYAEKQEAGKALRGSGLKKYKPGELPLSLLYINTATGLLLVIDGLISCHRDNFLMY